MKMLQLTLIGFGTLLAGMILAAMTLFLATSGDQSVPATVMDDPTLPSAQVENVTLHLREAGPEDAPVIIALHGGPGGDMTSLLPLEALADTHRVVFYDQRGAGLSERVEAEALTLDGYLAELDGVISLASPNAPVTLIGHSWGAMLASAYLGAHPDKVARAVLVEPGFLNAAEARDWTNRSRALMSGPRFIWKGLVTGFAAQHVKGDAHAKNDYLIGTMVGLFANHPDNPYHCPGSEYPGHAKRFGGLASNVAGKTSDAEFDRLALGEAFPGPVLFMGSSCNTWIGAELQAKHAERFANARLEVIEGAGHEMLIEKPEDSLAVIRDFLK